MHKAVLPEYLDVRILHQLLSEAPKGMLGSIRYFNRIKCKM